LDEAKLLDDGLIDLKDWPVGKTFTNMLRDREPALGWNKVSGVKEGDVVFSLPRTILRHQFGLAEDRLSFSTGFLEINDDGSLGNSASLNDIVKCHIDLTIPA
jgi:hypothetical protein